MFFTATAPPSFAVLSTHPGRHPSYYRQADELPQDIDAATREAKLENGVLTLKLGKQVPVSRVTELAIN